MTGTVETYVRGPGTTYDDLLKGYRTAFYFGTGMAGFAVIVVALFVRMPNVHNQLVYIKDFYLHENIVHCIYGR